MDEEKYSLDIPNDKYLLFPEKILPKVTVRICDRWSVNNHCDLPINNIISIGSVEDCPNISAFREKDFALYRFVFVDISHEAPEGPSLKIVQKMINIFKLILVNTESPDVLFHCAAGISRSTAAALIFLIAAGWSYQDACKEIYKVRGYTSPNLLMIKYADKILKQNGVMRNFVRANFGDGDYKNYKFD